MKETIIDLIENESENTKLDFKLEQYPIEKGNIKKGEFLKDMCAFANLVSEDDKFILIGVEEKNGTAIDFKPLHKLHDQASYQQFLNEYIEPEINFEYKEIIYKDHRLAYFRLFNNIKRPYLFKKEYKDTQPKGNQYKIGTGFVRTGTSTRELKRDDFEKIYAERFASKDRSNDINFKVTIGWFKSSILENSMYRHLQVDVTNLVNTYIDIDVEAKIYNNSNFIALYTQEAEAKMYQNTREKSMFARTPYLDEMFAPFVPINLNVEFEKHTSYSVYEITPKKGTSTALRLKQKRTETDIFNGQIALLFSESAEVKIELIVRSNEFPNGPKTFIYSISKEETQEILNPWYE